MILFVLFSTLGCSHHLLLCSSLFILFDIILRFRCYHGVLLVGALFVVVVVVVVVAAAVVIIGIQSSLVSCGTVVAFFVSCSCHLFLFLLLLLLAYSHQLLLCHHHHYLNIILIFLLLSWCIVDLHDCYCCCHYDCFLFM